VNSLVEISLGIPVMTPVDLLIDKPAGRVPDTRVQEVGGLPEAAKA
jgi:hypothetical protein